MVIFCVIRNFSVYNTCPKSDGVTTVLDITTVQLVIPGSADFKRCSKQRCDSNDGVPNWLSIGKSPNRADRKHEHGKGGQPTLNLVQNVIQFITHHHGMFSLYEFVLF